MDSHGKGDGGELYLWEFLGTLTNKYLELFPKGVHFNTYIVFSREEHPPLFIIIIRIFKSYIY
jgi:hypothetical protein